MEKSWAAVRLSSIAKIGSGRDIYDTERVAGDIPYITSGTRNNGIGYFVGNNNGVLARDVVVINRNGAVGSAFYHPYKALVSNDCRTVNLEGEVGSDGKLFLACAIAEQKECFSYSRKLGTARAEQLRIMLPVDDDGFPDWDYMSSFVKQLRVALLERYEKYVAKRLSELEYKDIPKLEDVDWQPFYVSSVFTTIARGKRLKKAEHTPGMTPYVSSTAMNNGVDGFIEDVPGTRVFGDCISLANSGSVGSAFYEPFDFVASDHVTHLKREGFTKWTYLFLAAVLEKQGVNFNFNREINDARISKMKIMLPANGAGKPDFDYMEQYAKNMMLRKYERYLAYRHGQTPPVTDAQ